MLSRPHYFQLLTAAVNRSPIVAILGPRQVGKTTLARQFIQDRQATYFDLESQPDLRRLQNPELALGALDGIVVIDEIQVLPELFAVLKVLVDRPQNQAHFLILGSASPDIVRNVSQTLAGRVEFIELNGFSLAEVGTLRWEELWVRGGFPRSFLADTTEDSAAWREGFIRTFLERDIPQLGITIPAPAMRRFWTMLAHYHGQIWNATELARSMGMSDKTVRSYLDILTGTFMVRQLQPWHANISKRQVKSPKIYLRDSGLLHSLLDVPDRHALLAHPRVGASWEGFAVEQVLQAVAPSQAYFWAAHAAAELDLLFVQRGLRFGVEVKFSEAPTVTRSMHNAVADLDLHYLWVVHPGLHSYPVSDRISVLAVEDISDLPDQIGQRSVGVVSAQGRQTQAQRDAGWRQRDAGVLGASSWYRDLSKPMPQPMPQANATATAAPGARQHHPLLPHWAATVAFYRRLGFPAGFENDWFVEFHLRDGAYLSIADASRASVAAVAGQGITLAWQVDNLVEVHNHLHAEGVAVTPIRRRWGAWVCYCHDPEGHRIELWADEASAGEAPA